MENYEKVIIIGNGFDLNLGLKTSYKHFLKSEDFIDLLEGGNLLAIHLQKQMDLFHWVDVENELKNYSKKAEGDLYKDFLSLSRALERFLPWVDIRQINVGSIAYSLISDNYKKNILILDFNYTDSVEKILISRGMPPEEISKKLRKVHGSLKGENMIFGVEDGAKLGDDAHIFLKKTANLKYNAPDVSTLAKNSSELCIFGHSLGETDHDYFKDYFMHRANNLSDLSAKKKLSIYYHNEPARLNLMKQIDKLTMNQTGKFRIKTEIVPISASMEME